MRLDTTNRHDWQGFTRILEIMSFLEDIESHSSKDIDDAIDKFCDLPPNPGQTMSMEEVVFWAGVATGMEYERRAGEEDSVGAASEEKMLVFSSLFAHSMKNAIVDLALGDLESNRSPWRRHRLQVGR